MINKLTEVRVVKLLKKNPLKAKRWKDVNCFAHCPSHLRKILIHPNKRTVYSSYNIIYYRILTKIRGPDIF